MKQTIKSILAFVALMLCGGAWAANTLACWNGDFVNGENRNGFVTTLRSSDANAVSFQDNGTVKLTGTSSVASEGLQILVPKNGIGTKQVSILVKYSGYSSNAYNSLLSTVWKGANVTVYATANGEKVGAAHSVSTTSGGTQGTPETYSGNVPSEGMMLVEFSGDNNPRGVKVSFARKNGDTYTDFTQAIYWSGVTYTSGNNIFTKFMVGGTVGPTSSYYRPSMTIEGVAIFDDHVAYDDAKAFAWRSTKDVYPTQKVIAIDFNSDNQNENNVSQRANQLVEGVDAGIPGIALDGKVWNLATNKDQAAPGATLKVYDTATNEEVAQGTAPTATWSCNNHYYAKCSSKSCLGCAELIYGYLDDSQGTPVKISNVPFAKYDVIAVFASDDTGNNTFGPVELLEGDATTGTKYTYSNGELTTGETSWGYHHNVVIQYGVNAMRIPNQTASTITVKPNKISGSRAGLAAVVLVESTQYWTGAAGDGNWNTAGNWKLGTVPTADDDVTITKSATISVTSASVAKSLKIAADVTITGAFAGGSIKKVTFKEGATLTADVANGSESKLQNVIGGKIIKTGAGALSFGTIDGNALNGTTVEIREGKALPTIYDNADAVMTDPTFIIGANGELTNYGWYTANGTLTIENAGDTAAFLSGSGIRGVTKIVKKGAGNLTFRSWKATNGTKEAFSCPIEIQAGRLTFFPHGTGYTVSGNITGAGSVGIVQGSQAGNSVILSGNNSYTGGTFVESGKLILGDAGALGGQGKTLRVETGAIFDSNSVGNFGAVLTLNGGTIANSGSGMNNNHVQYKGITLTKDSVADMAGQAGILNNSWNAATFDLGGFTLTKRGSGYLTLCNVTPTSGKIRLESGSIHVIGGNNTYPDDKKSNLSNVTLEVAGENVGLPGNYNHTFANVIIENDASLAAGTAAITVNGTLKINGSIAKATTVASTGTLDLSAVEGTSSAEKITGNLTINSGVAFKFPAGHTGAAYTLCGGTLSAPESYAGQVTVGDADPIPVTLEFDTTAKTVSYATALTEYALSDSDVTAINNANLSYGHATLIDVSAEISKDIAKEATITGVPAGYMAYGLGTKVIAVVKMNYEETMETKLNAAALHFDASRLNTIAADSSNNVTGWDNLGVDSTRPMATPAGNGRTANVSPTLGVQNQTVCIDFGECNSQKDLGWSRMTNIKAIIEVIDIAADKRAFLFGDYNNNSGSYHFHRGQENSNPKYFNGNSQVSKLYDNGVDKGNGRNDACPTGIRVISMTKTGGSLNSDCFAMDRNNCDNRSGGRKLYEVLVFTEELADADRVAIEDYLLRKWFNAKAVVNGVPKTSIQEALDAAEGNYANVHTLVEPTAQEIPDGWVWKNGSFYPVFAKVGQRSYASIEDAVASLQEGETIVEVVVKATSFVKAPADAAYTIKYTAGAGSDSEDGSRGVTLDHSAGKIILAGTEPYYLKGEWTTSAGPTITFDGATIYYKGSNENGTFGVPTATYIIQGNSRVEANRFILSQGAGGRTANVTIKDSAVVTVTGENDAHSNQATVMIGHWNGPSTLTIQDSAKLVVPNAGIHIGQTGNTQTINLNGGTLEAKGITMADNSATSKLNLAGGTLKLGEMGIDKYASKVLTISMTADTTIEATAATFPLEQAISVPTDKTLTFTSSTLTTLDISNITLATGAALDLSGCTALVSVPVGMKEDVASVPYSQITMPDGAAYAVTPTKSEYANGSLTVTDVPEGVNLKVQLPGEEVLGEMTRDGTTLTYKGDVKISGYATSFDITFNHKEDIGKSGSTDGTIDYAGVSGMQVRFDNAFKLVKPGENGPVELAQDEAVTKETGAHLMNHPYVENITGFYRNTDQLTFAVVGTMPNSMRTTFIHMGESRTGNDGGYGLLIATGDVKDEVIVAWNKGTEIHELTRMSVPNAATTRHVYVITKDDDRTADSSTFTVYLDGKKWKTIEQKPRFMIIGGLQVGSDFGGIIKDAYKSASEENKSKYFRQSAQDDGGVINVIRAYDRIITQEEIKQYSVETEYPYHSPNGSSARMFAEGSANWIETTSVWANTPAEGEASTDTTPLAGASVTATLDGASTIAVNVPVEGASYEALDIAGTGSATFTSATDSGAIRVTGMVTIGRPITVKPGSLDLGTAPITLLEDGTLTFDYSAFDANACEKETKINLTGDIAQDDTKVTCEKPSVDDFHTVNFAYDSSIKQYVLTIGLIAVDPEDPPVIEPENIPETWKDVPEVEGQGGRYFVENEEGKLEIKEGTPANGLTSYESYVLKLDPEDETSKPVVSAEQDSSATSITIVDNITVRDGKTATRKLKIGTTADNCAEVSADYNDGFTVDLPSGVDKVKFIKIEYIIQ